MTYRRICFDDGFAEVRLRSRGNEARNLGFGSLNYRVSGGAAANSRVFSEIRTLQIHTFYDVIYFRDSCVQKRRFPKLRYNVLLPCANFMLYTSPPSERPKFRTTMLF
jgi:hypothetical protein